MSALGLRAILAVYRVRDQVLAHAICKRCLRIGCCKLLDLAYIVEDLLERRALLRRLPASCHEFAPKWWAVIWRLEPQTLSSDLVHDSHRVQVCEWLLSRNHLPDYHTEAVNIYSVGQRAWPHVSVKSEKMD